MFPSFVQFTKLKCLLGVALIDTAFPASYAPAPLVVPPIVGLEDKFTENLPTTNGMKLAVKEVFPSKGYKKFGLVEIIRFVPVTVQLVKTKPVEWIALIATFEPCA